MSQPVTEETSQKPPRTFYTAREVAESTGLPIKQIYAACRAGTIPHQYFGKHLRIPARALHELQRSAVDAA